MEIANNVGHNKIILHTQTNSWLAAKLYLDYGFEILNKDEVMGWSILRTLVDHDKLKEYNILPKEEILDMRNVEIERQLIDMYGTEEFNYSVWYKNGLHNVYTYVNGIPYEYEYFIEDGILRLEEVEDYLNLIDIDLLPKELSLYLLDYMFRSNWNYIGNKELIDIVNEDIKCTNTNCPR